MLYETTESFHKNAQDNKECKIQYGNDGLRIIHPQQTHSLTPGKLIPILEGSRSLGKFIQ